MSMGSLFTGRTPSLESGDARAPLPWNGRNWCGLRRFALAAVDFCIPEGLPTLAEAFRDAGYWTAGISTNALMFRPAGYDRGFDAWVEVGPLQSDQLRPGGGPDVDPSSRDAQAANAAVAALLDERPSERFFLYVHYMDVHDHGIHPVRGYRAAVQRADTGVGELLALLADRGLRDGATILLVSDHGERLRERHVVAGRPSHYGNPAFEEHLAIPLIVAPAHFGETDRFLRSDAIYGLIQQLAGISQASAAEVEPDELFLSERRYQTYRQGRWKLYRERASGAVQLVDLESDPGETRDISARHPDIAARMLARIETLAGSLAAAPQGTIEPTGLTPDDKRRLQMLGYVE
jgi:arylsulfatase A-like enzyme